MYPSQVPQSIQQAKKQTQMESQQDVVDLTINDDDDCLFPTELGEMVNSLLKMDGTEGNKETAKQNHEDDTLRIYGSEDGEIVTDEEEEKEEESQILEKKSQEKQHSNPLHSMFTHAAIKLSIQGKWKGSVWDSK